MTETKRPEHQHHAWLEIQRASGAIDVRAVKPEGSIGVAEGSCPGCGAKPFWVQGAPVPQTHEDAERVLMAGGRCTECNDPVGYLYARKPSTIFGAEEDQAVLGGMARVIS